MIALLIVLVVLILLLCLVPGIPQPVRIIGWILVGVVAVLLLATLLGAGPFIVDAPRRPIIVN